MRVADDLEAWTQAQGHSLVEPAIAWTPANSAVTSCIVGAKTPEQVRKNAEAAQWELTEDDLREIDEIRGGFRIRSLRR